MFNPTWSRYLRNILGWHTNLRIVVIESDDWGSIRMPSVSSFEKLEKSGLDLRSLDAERYNLNDSLETKSDLESLFNVLSKFTDSTGKKPVFTPITIVANPDFEKIEESGFSEYFYEPFTDTLQKYHGNNSAFELWKEGIGKRLFVPQMHGREHLNVTAWLRALKNGDHFTRLAFSEKMWGFVPNQNRFPKEDYQAAFLLRNTDELTYQSKVIIDGLNLFNNLFGYKAEYFVPPNGPFNNSLNKVLIDSNIKFRYSSTIQNESLGQGEFRKVLHWLGQEDKSGIRYILRNCFFEPSQSGKDWVDYCLNDIRVAFGCHKPAIISTHRVNFIGSLNPANRDKGLKQLEQLLHAIMKKWPDTMFMTTSELGKLLIKKPKL